MRKLRSPWSRPKTSTATKLTLYGILLSLAIVAAPAQPALRQQLDSLMHAFVRNTFFSGVVLVANNDSLIYERSFGFADRERNIPNTASTSFNIASMGKTFTSVLIMQLVESGRLDLHAPIRTYLSEDIPNADRITIHHLLTHTSGLSNYMMHPDYNDRRRKLRSLSDVMELVIRMPLAFDTPGERFEYSNSAYIVLGRIIEKVTGKDYVTYVNEKLWRPLGMTGTFIAHPLVLDPPHQAMPYYVFSERSSVSALSDENPAFSDGGAFSNARDLLKFLRALLSETLLKPQTMQLMFTPYSKMSAQLSYGYGWSVAGESPGTRVVGHSGGGLGYSNDMRILPDKGTIVIVQANLRTSPRSVTESILRLLTKGTLDLPRQSPASMLFGAMERKGVAAVLDSLNAFIASNGLTMPDSPRVLVDVADAFSTLRRYDDALLVHRKNVSLFPASTMPYNAMGAMYLAMGKKNEAEQSFRKALEIDPHDAYARMQLGESR